MIFAPYCWLLNLTPSEIFYSSNSLIKVSGEDFSGGKFFPILSKIVMKMIYPLFSQHFEDTISHYFAAIIDIKMLSDCESTISSGCF